MTEIEFIYRRKAYNFIKNYIPLEFLRIVLSEEKIQGAEIYIVTLKDALHFTSHYLQIPLPLEHGDLALFLLLE